MDFSLSCKAWGGGWNFSSNELLLHMSRITLLHELWLVVFTSVTRHTP
jgi:hypothetical protein